MIIRLLDHPETTRHLLPLTFTRAISSLRLGIDTLIEKWQSLLPGHEVYAEPAEALLRPLYPAPTGDTDIILTSNIVPDAPLAQAVASLRHRAMLVDPSGRFIACRDGGGGREVTFDAAPVRFIDTLPHLFLLNGEAITADFDRLTAGRASAAPGPGVTLIGPPSRLFIALGARVAGCVINVEDGPVYVGPGAEIAEGSCVRGPVAVLGGARVNMGAKIHPATTVGPHSRVGGELNNVVIQGYSNKAHDGFLGNAVIGEWCNLGAGCTASNLKNDYSPVRLWDYAEERFAPTGLQFCGLIMGDHSKAGINTMFNTATVVGVGCNIHGSGFPRTFIPSFSDGGAAGFRPVAWNAFVATARIVMQRRGQALSPAAEHLLHTLHTLHTLATSPR